MRISTWIALGALGIMLTSGSAVEAKDPLEKLKDFRKSVHKKIKRGVKKRLERHEERARRVARSVRSEQRRARRYDHEHRSHSRENRRHRDCGCFEIYEPAHYKTVTKRVWIPGRYERIWVPARYETRRIGGCHRTVLVRSGHYERVWSPGYHERVQERIRVPGRWVLSRGCRGHRGR